VTDHLRYGGTLGACELDAWHLGLGSSYGVRGFAKAKKIKARSDYDRDEALESVVPSAKETATELMEAAMDALAKDLAKLRTGRASPGMLDHVTVESHGVRVPLPHVAAVSMPNLETLTVMPYDPSVSLPLPNSLGSLC
jgi:ribosome recycling factor